MVKTGHTFSGWNTASDGSGTGYAPDQTLEMDTADVTLYAQWSPIPTYAVTYDGNGNSGGSVPTDGNNYEEGATVTVLANTGGLVKTGHTFSGWNTASDGSGTSYAVASTFAMGSADVTLYANWSTATNVNFTTIGGATNGNAQDGDHGSSDVPGKTMYFLGVHTSGSGYFKVYDTGAAPAAGVSGIGFLSVPTSQAYFRISTYNDAVDFMMIQFDVYNPTGSTVTLAIEGWNAWNPPVPATGDVASVSADAAPNGWTTIPLTGFVGVSSIVIDFPDTTELYFNQFWIE